MREERNGITILRSWMYVPNPVTSLGRVIHEGSFVAGALARSMASKRPDVILAVSPPLGNAMAAVILSRLWRVPYVFHVTDLQPDAAVDLGMLRPGRLVQLLYRLEALAYRRAARVSTLTEAMRKKIIAKGFPADKVVLFSDWTDPELFSLPITDGGNLFRQRFELRARTLVVHAGNMGVKQGLDVVLDAAELARDSNPTISFLLVGDGAMRTKLKQEARCRKLDNVVFLPLLPSELFHDLLAASDISLVTQQKTVADIVFPSKVLTLLAAGRAIVASLSEGSGVARVLAEAGAGVRTEAEDPRALLEAVRALASDPHRRHAMGSSGRAYARQHWDRETILANLERHLLSVINGLRPSGEDGAVRATFA